MLAECRMIIYVNYIGVTSGRMAQAQGLGSRS